MGLRAPALLSGWQHTRAVKAAPAGIAPGVRHRAGVPPGVSVAEGAHAEPDCFWALQRSCVSGLGGPNLAFPISK